MIRRTLLFLLALATIAGPTVHAQTRIELLPESRLWIDGTSTVNRFTCKAGEIDGYGSIPSPIATIALGARAARAEAQLTVPVATFDCGDRRMNRDFRAAMQAEEHPEIVFTLDDAELLPAKSEAAIASGGRRVRATGWLSIAGVRRHVEAELTAERLADGRLYAVGDLPLRMTDFGIRPPTALMGLVRAHDDIVVRVNLLAAEATPRMNQ